MSTAAVWWRVSTDDQKEISPDTQTAAAVALAEQEGYTVSPEHIIGTDWGSLSVWDSPPMDRLKALIRERSITAIFMYDADRGPAKPAHRLLLRALCEEKGVVVRCCYGEILGGEMGEVMEFLSAWSKEKQVHRAQQGAKDGLRDRAKIKGLPVNGKAPYGYQFRYEMQGDKSTPVSLEPEDMTYPVASKIWAEAVVGTAIRGICKKLTDAGIPTPKGGPAWNTSTIYHILTTPVYGGRFYALRKEAKTPITRSRQTYGKTSSASLPRDQWHHLEGFPITSPVVTWAEWEGVQERLRFNKLQSRRNTKRPYLLSGMLFCGHDGRRLRGTSKKNGRYWYYRCTLYGQLCTGNQIRGQDIEPLVWDKVSSFLADPQTFMAEIERSRAGGTDGEVAVEKSIKALQQRQQTVDARETELVNMKLRD